MSYFYTQLLRVVHTKWGPFVLLMLVVALVFGRGVWSPFLWDDEVMIVGNPLIRSWASVPEIFTSAAFGGTASGGQFYRPIQILSYLLDYHLWGMTAFGFHVTSLIWHGINGWLFFAVFCGLGFSRCQSFMTALIVTIHPIHIEAVTYLSGRGDLLYLTFALLAMLLFLKNCSVKGSRFSSFFYFLGSVLAYALSILSKENGIALPILLAVIWFFFHKESSEKSRFWVWSSLISSWILMGGVVIWRLLAAHGQSFRALSDIAFSSVWDRFLTLPHILWTYWRLLVWPYPLHMEYHFVDRTILTPYWLIFLPLMGLMLIVVYVWIRDKKWVWIFLTWIAVGIAPVSQVALPLASTVREHWINFAIAGVLGLGLMCWRQWMEQRRCTDGLSGYGARILWVVLGGWILSIGVLGWLRVGDWLDAERLYAHDVALEPRSFLLHNNLGVIYFRQGRLDEAKTQFESAIRVSPGQGYSVAFNNLGVIVEQEGDVARALDLYRRSIATGDYVLAYGNLGRVLLRQGDYQSACDTVKTGIRKFPYDGLLQQLSRVCMH